MCTPAKYSLLQVINFLISVCCSIMGLEIINLLKVSHVKFDEGEKEDENDWNEIWIEVDL